jgi:hypothetical protein
MVRGLGRGDHSGYQRVSDFRRARQCRWFLSRSSAVGGRRPKSQGKLKPQARCNPSETVNPPPAAESEASLPLRCHFALIPCEAAGVFVSIFSSSFFFSNLHHRDNCSRLCSLAALPPSIVRRHLSAGADLRPTAQPRVLPQLLPGRSQPFHSHALFLSLSKPSRARRLTFPPILHHVGRSRPQWRLQRGLR